MKIVYVNDALAIWGGLERILIEKVNWLADEYGYEVYILTTNQGNHPILYSLSPKVSHIDLEIGFHQQYRYKGLYRLYKKLQLNRLFIKRLRTFFHEKQPDIIVVVRSQLLSSVAKAKDNVPLVFESHTSCCSHMVIVKSLYARLMTFIGNMGVRKVQQVVALTEGDANDWRKFNPNVCVIPNIVHLNGARINSDCQSKSAIFVGRFSKQKDIGSLLRVWAFVHEHHPEWQLHIYGGYGGEEEWMLPKIKEHDMNVRVHEPTPDIFEKYCENSILLLTSAFEPFGLVLPEAMSCGLPVVAFDCPYGPADIITDGYDGFLVKERDIRLYAEKVCLLIETPDLRVKMGQAGIQSSKRYEASLIMPHWKELFEQIVKKEKDRNLKTV